MPTSIITSGSVVFTSVFAGTSTTGQATSTTTTTSSAAPTTTSTTTTSALIPSTTTTSTTSIPSTTTTTSSTVPSSTTVLSTTTTTSTSSSASVPVVTVTFSSTKSFTTTASSTATTTAASKGHSSGFFSNTGAVAGVFTVVGLIGLALVGIVIMTIIRQRRARQLDQEIAAAAAGANFNNAAFEDDDYDHHNGGAAQSNSYYGTSTGTHGAYNQPPMEMTRGGQWDPYAQQPSYGVGEVIGAPGAYGAMPDRGRRTSTGTGTSAGMAGFGARGAVGTRDTTSPGYPPFSDGSATLQDQLSSGHEHNDQYYGNPGGFAAAAGAGSPTGEYHDPYGHMPVATTAATGTAVFNHYAQAQNQGYHDEAAYEDHDDAYGGEEYDDDHHPQPTQPPLLQGVHRQNTSGTFQDAPEPPRTLKVANE